MPKLAIYVPKPELKLIEKWRKRLNFSQLFMRALHEEIAQQKHKGAKAADVATAGKLARAAQFYRQQIEQSAESLNHLGLRIGTEQVLGCQLEASTIEKVVSLSQKDDKLSPDDMLMVTGFIGSTSIADERRVQKLDESAREELARGYIDGVTSAWEKVLAAIKDD